MARTKTSARCLLVTRTYFPRLGEWDTDKELGWGGYISSGVEIRNLPGNHDTWLVEHAQEFGEVLNSCLEPQCSFGPAVAPK